jgi:hypothetical protein
MDFAGIMQTMELKGDMQALPIFVHYGVLTRFGGVRKINCYLSVADSRSKAVRKKVFVLLLTSL